VGKTKEFVPRVKTADVRVLIVRDRRKGVASECTVVLDLKRISAKGNAIRRIPFFPKAGRRRFLKKNCSQQGKEIFDPTDTGGTK